MDHTTRGRSLKASSHPYDVIGHEWDRLRQRPREEWNAFLPFVAHGARVLDAGCGNGRLYDFLNGRDVRYTGVDSSEVMIKIAKARSQKSEVGGQTSDPRFLICDIQSLPFSDESFDVVFCCAVLHHLETPAERLHALTECYRVLAVGGMLFLTNWNLLAVSSMLRQKLWHPAPLVRFLTSRNATIPWKIPGVQTFYRFYHSFRLKELRELLKEAGFDIQELRYDRRGIRACWWSGLNSIAIAKKPALPV